MLILLFVYILPNIWLVRVLEIMSTALQDGIILSLLLRSVASRDSWICHSRGDSYYRKRKYILFGKFTISGHTNKTCICHPAEGYLGRGTASCRCCGLRSRYVILLSPYSPIPYNFPKNGLVHT